jgi:stage II sporulation protein D
MNRLAAVALLAGTLAAGCGGTSLAAQAPPMVRVELGRPRASAALRIAGPWRVEDDAGRGFRDSGFDLSTTLGAYGGGVTFRDASTRASTLRVRVDSTFTLDALTYHGDLIVRVEGEKLTFVNELDLETYVAGVIVNEMGPDRTPAAYRAQAVAARSYAYRAATVDPGPTAARHLYDDERSQVYKGLFLWPGSATTTPELEGYVRETRGVILTWRGRPFPTYYSSTCGGHTCDCATSALDPGGAAEVLRGVPCWYCGDSKYFSWTQVVPTNTLLEGLKPRGIVGPLTNLEVTKTGPGGRASEVTVTFGPRGARKVVPAGEIRGIGRLKSARWSAPQASGDGWQFSGYGFGHGVGMCQMGAIEMGRRGFSDSDILRYYYPGAEFTRLY